MNRQEILEFINEIIVEEHGNAVTEEQLLVECGIDSFGYAILWISINQKYGIDEVKGIDSKINYSTLLVSDVIDYIVTKDNKYIVKTDNEDK